MLDYQVLSVPLEGGEATVISPVGKTVPGLADLILDDSRVIFRTSDSDWWSNSPAGGSLVNYGPGIIYCAEPSTKTLLLEEETADGTRLVQVPVAGGARVPVTDFFSPDDSFAGIALPKITEDGLKVFYWVDVYNKLYVSSLATPTPTTPTSTPSPTATATPSPTPEPPALVLTNALLGAFGETDPVDANEDSVLDCADLRVIETSR